MEPLRGIIFFALLGIIFPTALSETPWCQTSPVGDRYAPEVSDAAVYVHEFSFQRVVDVTYKDTKGPDANTAFRDVELFINPDTGCADLEARINLDQQPS